MESREFVQVLKILDKASLKWNPPVIDLMAAAGDEPFKVLVATVISARTRDEVTAVVAPKLFAKASDPEALAKLSEKTIASLIFPAGFYKVKAGNLKKLAKILEQEYASVVPETIEELVALPGVGRKTANLVLAQAFHKPAICVDIHVHRITNRLGFIATKTPLETEMALRDKVAKKHWQRINSLFVAFGQTICRPVNPKCDECPLKKVPCLYRDAK